MKYNFLKGKMVSLPIFIFIFFTSFNSYLNAQVIKYKAVLFTTTKYKGENKKPPIQKECNFLVVINLSKLKINLYSNTEQELDIVKRGEIIKKEKFTIHEYSCVDSDGEKCIVGYSVYEEGNKYTAGLLFDYGDSVYIYYLIDD